MHEKVGVIGHFGFGHSFCDGQTVKTRNLAMLLEQSGYAPAVKVDTYLFKEKNLLNPLKLLFNTLRCMFLCKYVFLMVSVNGMKFYLPFLYYLNKLTKRRIYHYVIGSELLSMIDEDPDLIPYLNALEVNWFEYESGTAYLRSKGVKNAATLANFKVIDPVEQVVHYSGEQYRVCTFSRVMEEKGITEAIRTVRDLNEELGAGMVMLDIYGPVQKTYEQFFSQLLRENSHYVRYMGIVESDCSADVLNQYYALLFPTRWVGEGFPGTIIDAFASGIPVIASDWNANKELIEHGEQGLIYPKKNMHSLTDAVRWAIQNPERMEKMRHSSRAEFEKYMPASIAKVIIRELQKK